MVTLLSQIRAADTDEDCWAAERGHQIIELVVAFLHVLAVQRAPIRPVPGYERGRSNVALKSLALAH
jgi:hypothetical protein